MARQLGEWKRGQLLTGARKLYTREGLHEIEEVELATQSAASGAAATNAACATAAITAASSWPRIVGHAVTELAAADVAPEARCKIPTHRSRQPNIRMLKESASSTVIEMDFPINGQISGPMIYRLIPASRRGRIRSHRFSARRRLCAPGFRDKAFANAVSPRHALSWSCIASKYGFGGSEGYLLTEKIDHADDSASQPYVHSLHALAVPRADAAGLVAPCSSNGSRSTIRCPASTAAVASRPQGSQHPRTPLRRTAARSTNPPPIPRTPRTSPVHARKLRFG